MRVLLVLTVAMAIVLTGAGLAALGAVDLGLARHEALAIINAWPKKIEFL